MMHDHKKQYGLALHTTTPQLGLAVGEVVGLSSGDTAQAQVWDLGREMSGVLHPYLGKFLAPLTWQDLAFLAVAQGPGGFTGTRIGIVTVRTLGQQLEIPVFPVSTLAAIAHSSFLSDPCPLNTKIAVEYPARREQIFVAIYEVMTPSGQLNTVLEDTVMTPDAWQTVLESLGDCDRLLQANHPIAQTVSSILHLAAFAWEQGQRPHWTEAFPFYGQQPV